MLYLLWRFLDRSGDEAISGDQTAPAWRPCEPRNDSTKRTGFATIAVRTGRWTQLTDKAQISAARGLPRTTSLQEMDALSAFIAESDTEPPDVWIAGKDFRHRPPHHDGRTVNG